MGGVRGPKPGKKFGHHLWMDPTAIFHFQKKVSKIYDKYVIVLSLDCGFILREVSFIKCILF